MRYELMELSTGNLVGAYSTEAEALSTVASTIRQFGESSVDTLALGIDESPVGPGRTIAEGRALATLARQFAREHGESPVSY